MPTRLLLAALTTALVAACTHVPPRLNLNEKEAAIFSWLDCEECYNGQYEYVISLGPQVKRLLEQAAGHGGVFGASLDARRLNYYQRSRRAAADIFGFDIGSLTPAQEAQVHSRADELATIYVNNDKRRHAQRADKALSNLNRTDCTGCNSLGELRREG